jgi:hypothetical protein
LRLVFPTRVVACVHTDFGCWNTVLKA